MSKKCPKCKKPMEVCNYLDNDETGKFDDAYSCFNEKCSNEEYYPIEK